MIDIGYTPSEEERVKELIKQGKDAVCSLPDKKAFASTCLALKNDVIKDIKSVDPSGSSDLSSQVGEFLHLGRIRQPSRIQTTNIMHHYWPN